ncbi:sulfurtransferase [Sphingobacterium corticibacter]|uniref:Sulfurtransferase n=1 Tax=Sphingobacterium corticibacter TaxID=2171749 RepID=A0A2T8HG33_9SPHI|nr:sulfurtransferase [Sphingobacterium corticibacter]PVH24401.1 sulfurtransferase [Sphingobacterium corticibacter]
MNTFPLIDVKALQALLDEQKPVVLLDATIDKVNQQIDQDGVTPELIPNSIFFDIEGAFSDHSNPLPHTMIDAATFESEARALGINANSMLVTYDRWGIYSSPRAWWMFRAMGHTNTFVLQGGLPAWKAQQLPVVSKHMDTATLTKGNFVAKPQNEYWINKEEILRGLQQNENTIIDARSAGRFAGSSPEPRAGLQSGHIPGSHNLPFDEVLAGTHYKGVAELQNIFEPLISDKPVVFSCGSGISPAIIALAAQQLDYPNLSIYDGSWSEWGADENVPIEKG